MGVLDGCHKIGKTVAIGRRLGEVGAALPVALAVVHAISTDNTRWLERYLHAAFRDVRARGEWFRLTESDIDTLRGVATACTATDLPSAVAARYAANASLPTPVRAPTPRKKQCRAQQVGAILEAERVEQGITLSDLARRSGLSTSTVHDITSGRNSNPGILTVEKVLVGLGRNLGWIESRFA